MMNIIPDKYKIRKNEITLLVGGRIFKHITPVFAYLILLQIWGGRIFGEYSSKMGTWIILVPIFAVGVTKASLKLIPCYQYTKNIIIRYSLIIGLIFTCLCILVVVLTNMIRWAFAGTIDYVDIQLGIFAIQKGLIIAFQGIGRSVYKNYFDYNLSLLTGSIFLVVSLIVFFYSITPIYFVTFLNLSFLVLNFYSFLNLYKQYPIPKKFSMKIRKTVFYRFLRESIQMGSNSFLALGSYSAVFIGFRYWELYEHAAYFSLASAIITMAVGFFQYFTHIFIPDLANAIQNNSISTRKLFASTKIRRVGFGVLISIGIGISVSITEYFITSDLFNYLYPIIIWIFLLPGFFLYELMLLWFEMVSMKSQFYSMIGSGLGFIAASLFAFFLVPQGTASIAIFALLAGHTISISFVLLREKYY